MSLFIVNPPQIGSIISLSLQNCNKKQKKYKKAKKSIDKQKKQSYNLTASAILHTTKGEKSKMNRNYDELRKKIRGKYLKQSDFAIALGCTQSTISVKLAGRSDWTRSEIEKMKDLLNLSSEEIFDYFF